MTPADSSISSADHSASDPINQDARADRALAAPFYLMAFLSGAAALIYEVTWARMLGLTFGSTILSTAGVIAGFMGGMGLGAWLYHILDNRIARPLAAYAGLELGIALTTALLTRTFYHLPGLFARACAALPPGPWLDLVRFAGILVLLLVPAALMGATFPALCRVMIHTVRGVDRHLGKIYGINTIGAAIGALLAGLLLIENLGLAATVTAANLVNLAVGAAALLLGRLRPERVRPPTRPAAETIIPTFLPQWLLGAVLFFSGFATLSYELLWFRALRFLVGNSTYALTTVLAVFLVGLGLGSLGLERTVRRGSPERDLALVQGAIAALALVAMACCWLVAYVPGLRDQVSIFAGGVRGSPWWLRLLNTTVLAALTMLPATLFMGLSFPLASRLFLGDVRRIGVRIGGAYLLANLGSILGALAAAVVLLPRFSSLGGTKVVALLNLALAGAILLFATRRGRGWRLPAASAALVAVLLAAVLPASLNRVGEASRRARGLIVFAQDDDLATVHVIEEPASAALRTMTIDGCQIGWSEGYRGQRTYQKQVLLAHVPMLLDNRIRRTLNVGLGSAATLKALASYPQVQTLDCVEIGRAVVAASRLFPESDVLNDPRVTLTVDDAVHFLLRPGPQYDLIISDGKQSPFFSGNATLLCREFYAYANRRLTDDGIFIQWLPLGTLHSDFRIALRTCCDAFPFVEVMYLPPDSVFVLASRRSLFDRPVLAADLVESLPVGDELRTYLLEGPSALFACWSSGKPQLEGALGDGPLSVWDHLLLDFTPYKATPAQWARTKRENLTLLADAERTPRPTTGNFGRSDPRDRESAATVRRALLRIAEGQRAEARTLLDQATQLNPTDRLARAVRTAVVSGQFHFAPLEE